MSINAPRNEEEYLRHELHLLYESYRKAAEPILKRLMYIEGMKPRPPFMIDIANIDPEILKQLEANCGTPT